MSPIPQKLRKQLSEDPEYKICARAMRSGHGGECRGRITFEHAILYANRQVQERWAIIPLCVYHHLGVGLNKRWNINYALSRATREELAKYPRLKI